jgi:Domain of unknown function (DUF4833)
MVSRRSLLLFVAAAAVAASTALPALATSATEPLFFIQRSKNAAEVHYDARLNADGTLDAKNPVDGYWFNRHPDGSVSRNDITFFQKIAYGYDTQATGNGTYVFKLRAFHERPMWIVKNNGHWVVQTTIAGKQAYMKRLYVATDESGVMPKVLYVDVFGEDAASGAAVTEHIVKT